VSANAEQLKGKRRLSWGGGQLVKENILASPYNELEERKWLENAEGEGQKKAEKRCLKGFLSRSLTERGPRAKTIFCKGEFPLCPTTLGDNR